MSEPMDISYQEMQQAEDAATHMSFDVDNTEEASKNVADTTQEIAVIPIITDNAKTAPTVSAATTEAEDFNRTEVLAESDTNVEILAIQTDFAHADISGRRSDLNVPSENQDSGMQSPNSECLQSEQHLQNVCNTTFDGNISPLDITCVLPTTSVVHPVSTEVGNKDSMNSTVILLDSDSSGTIVIDTDSETDHIEGRKKLLTMRHSTHESIAAAKSLARAVHPIDYKQPSFNPNVSKTLEDETQAIPEHKPDSEPNSSGSNDVSPKRDTASSESVYPNDSDTTCGEISDEQVFDDNSGSEKRVTDSRTPLGVLNMTFENTRPVSKEEKNKLPEPLAAESEDKENMLVEDLFSVDNKPLIMSNTDYSAFVSSSSKKPRESILQLFDPFYTTKQSSPKSGSPLVDKPAKESSTLISISDYPEEYNTIQELKELLDEANEIEYTVFRNQLPQVVKEVKEKMESHLDQSIKSEQEVTALKLELNQLQQERTTLELELHQKDEIILKTQGEAQKKEGQYKQEMKLLQEKLANISDSSNNVETEALKAENEVLKKKHAESLEKIAELTSNEAKLRKIMNEFESSFSKKVGSCQKLKDEHDTAKKHLATLEMSFSDLHTKYERSKDIIAGYKDNEEMLTRNLEASNEIAQKNEQRYISLKAHAKAQLDKSNKELLLMKEKHQLEVNKLSAVVRRLEIKYGSVQQALEQKSAECQALAALCDEMTGPMPEQRSAE